MSFVQPIESADGYYRVGGIKIVERIMDLHWFCINVLRYKPIENFKAIKAGVPNRGKIIGRIRPFLTIFQKKTIKSVVVIMFL